jgi:mRNA interferase RelE/StbE
LAWRIEFDDSSKKVLKKLDPQTAGRITKFMRERVAPLENPRQLGEAMQGSKLGEFWKYRVGDWRIIARIEDQSVLVLVVRIGNRREVYRR